MQFETKAALENRATLHRSPARSAWMRLLGEVMRLADGKGELLRHGERAWASATFAGTRHVIALNFTGEDAIAAGEHFIAALPDHEFDLCGHLVADAVVSAVDHAIAPQPTLTVEVEILLLEDL